MKKLLLLCVACVMAVGLVGCSSPKQETTETSEYESTVLNVMNWGEYIGEDVISNFEKEFGVRVNYTLYDSNEMLYTKITHDDSYDVVVPADYMLDRLIKEDMLQPLDYSIITNTDNINERAFEVLEELDPGHVYSMPYFLATAGIVYDKNKVSLEDLEEKGWGIMKDTRYAGDIFLYDSERDSFMMALKDLGYSANTTDEAEIAAAYDWLAELHETMKPAYVTDEVIDAMINGEKALAFVYSGDAAYITTENEDMGYYVPESGSRIAVDGLVIPKNSKNAKLANEFINFMFTYESALDNSLTVGYTSCDNRVLAELSGEGGEYEGNNAYLFDLDNPNSEIFFDNAVLREFLSEEWIKIKSK